MPTATPAPERLDARRVVASIRSAPSASDRLARLRRAAARPVPADSVAAFRVLLGLLVAAGSVRFLANGWVDTLYLEPEHHLTYRWFGWVTPLPAPWMHLHLAALAVLGLCIAAGYRHRPAAGLFVVGFAYTELIDATLYLNHYWFVTLAGVLLLALPVHHRWSLDAVAGRVEPSATVAAGVVWALRAQVGVVYAFAGLAKLNPDWLFRAQPLRLWLADRTGTPFVGPILDEPAVAFLASWWGAAFDCTIVGWLLWRRSRPVAYLALVAFHLATGALFRIGIFPWIMIAGALVFFEPDWPRRLWSRLRPGTLPPAGSTDRDAPDTVPVGTGGAPAPSRPVVAALGLLAVVQLVLPLRHHAIDGQVRWTEEGYLLAWRVMLTEKAGHVEYEITDPTTGDRWRVGPELVLNDQQASAAATRPDLIHATAHLLADHFDDPDRADDGTGTDGGPAGPARDVEVRADAWVTMNGRPPQRIVDPRIDLAAHPRGGAPAGWILPLATGEVADP